jgi:hypothetical protein
MMAWCACVRYGELVTPYISSKFEMCFTGCTQPKFGVMHFNPGYTDSGIG